MTTAAMPVRGGQRVGLSFDLVINALIAGILLGGFYAAVTIGVSISFGILDIVNIAHPAFIILGSYIAYIVNARLGLDPIATSVIMLPAFYVLGAGVYQVYYESFERRGQEALRGLSFFFGLLFVTEVMLILVFGVDYRYVEAAYIGPSWRIGVMDLPLRMLVPCIAALAMFAALELYLSYTFIGRAISAVAQDQLALRLMGASPIRIKRIAFGISIATAAVAGALLIIIQPVEPSVGREYIGRVFAAVRIADRANAGLSLGFDRGRGCRVLRCAPGEQRLRILRRLHGLAIRRTGDRLEYSRRIYRLRQFRLGRVLRAGRLCDGIPAQIVSIADPAIDRYRRDRIGHRRIRYGLFDAAAARRLFRDRHAGARHRAADSRGQLGLRRRLARRLHHPAERDCVHRTVHPISVSIDARARRHCAHDRARHRALAARLRLCHHPGR